MNAKHVHCSNPECERSRVRRHEQGLEVRDRPILPGCFIIEDDGPPAAAGEIAVPPADAVAQMRWAKACDLGSRSAYG